MQSNCKPLQLQEIILNKGQALANNGLRSQFVGFKGLTTQWFNRIQQKFYKLWNYGTSELC